VRGRVAVAATAGTALSTLIAPGNAQHAHVAGAKVGQAMLITSAATLEQNIGSFGWLLLLSTPVGRKGLVVGVLQYCTGRTVTQAKALVPTATEASKLARRTPRVLHNCATAWCSGPASWQVLTCMARQRGDAFLTQTSACVVLRGMGSCWPCSDLTIAGAW